MIRRSRRQMHAVESFSALPKGPHTRYTSRPNFPPDARVRLRELVALDSFLGTGTDRDSYSPTPTSGRA